MGLDAVTTNGIAERADVNVASLYSYFPNKYAVITALAMRSWDDGLSLMERMQVLGEERDWREALDQGIDAVFENWRSRPGSASLLLAQQVIPELRDLHDRTSALIVERVATWLHLGGLIGGPKRARAIASAIFFTTHSVAHAALLSEPEDAERLITELKLLLVSYLENYAD